MSKTEQNLVVGIAAAFVFGMLIGMNSAGSTSDGQWRQALRNLSPSCQKQVEDGIQGQDPGEGPERR